MFVDIKVADLEAIKRDIAHHTPHASASHRAEAMARGFGFGTYAALRSALATGPVRVPVHASAFSRFLSERGCSTTEFGPKHHAGSLTPLHLAVLALWIRPVLEGHPHLNRNGLAPIRFGEWDKGFWTPRRLAAMCASPEGKERLAADRTAMLSASALAEFGRCMEFLSRTHRLKQATAKSRDSYGLKHAVERWWRGPPQPSDGSGRLRGQRHVHRRGHASGISGQTPGMVQPELLLRGSAEEPGSP